MNNIVEKMKNLKFLYLFLILLLIGGWFYWTQIRPASIRKKCYIEVYVSSKTNTKWTEGKVWRSVGFDGRNSIWGWDYAGNTEVARNNNCLLLNGINPSTN